MRRGVFLVRHFYGRSGSGELDETRHIFSKAFSRTWRHGGSREQHDWRLQSIRGPLCLQNCCAANTTINNSYFLLKWPTALFLMSQNRQMRSRAVNRLARVYLSSLALLTAAGKSSEILRLLECLPWRVIC